MNEAKINELMNEVDLFAGSRLVQQKEICLCRFDTKLHYFLKLLFDFLAGIWCITFQFLPLRWLMLSSRDVHILGAYLRLPVVMAPFSSNIDRSTKYCQKITRD